MTKQEKLRAAFIEKCADRWSEYELIGEYKNKNTKTLFLHKKCGNRFEMLPHNFRHGSGCPKCANKQRAESLKKAKGSRFLEYLSNHSEYELRTEYINNTTKVRLYHELCKKEFDYLPQRFKAGSGAPKYLCPYCNRNRLKEKYIYSLEQANARLQKKNPEYEFLSYAASHESARVLHKKCGTEFEQQAYYLLNGDGHCPKCTTHISKEEREIYEWLSRFRPNIKATAKKVVGVSEIDIFDEEKKVGIEFNGHWWHSFQCMTRPNWKTGEPRMTDAQAKNFHYNKSKACEEQGIRLIHIWDYEWQDPRKQKVLKNIILGALGMLPERYYARQCEVKRYDKDCPRWKELNQFFAENNIQGNRGGTVVFTLEREGRILMAYKFGRPSGGLAKKKYQYEMVRGASAPGVQVVGGASKLWKHFVEEMKPKSVVYYIDYNYFDGRSVEKLGGKFIGSQPGVKNYWVKTKEVKNREPGRHKEVKEAIEKGEVLELWNAGTKTYAFVF